MTSDDDVFDSKWSEAYEAFGRAAIERMAPLPAGISAGDIVKAEATRAALAAQLLVTLDTVNLIIANSHQAMASYAPKSEPSGPTFYLITGNDKGNGNGKGRKKDKHKERRT